jgi:pimeloyl-ACP methyl ester carboxylesterase
VLHGADDPVVPPTHAHWYAAHLPRARLEIIPGELHLSSCLKSARVSQKAVRELESVGGAQRVALPA